MSATVLLTFFVLLHFSPQLFLFFHCGRFDARLPVDLLGGVVLEGAALTVVYHVEGVASAALPVPLIVLGVRFDIKHVRLRVQTFIIVGVGIAARATRPPTLALLVRREVGGAATAALHLLLKRVLALR